MHKKQCDCGRVLYEDISMCPNCGRPLYLNKHAVLQWDEDTNKRSEGLATATVNNFRKKVIIHIRLISNDHKVGTIMQV